MSAPARAGVQVEVLETSELGDRSYVAHDGATALVVDPQRDIDRVEHLLAERGLVCAAVAETHVHNDYVSGGLELARRSGADYLVNAADPVSFERVGVSDGAAVEVGGLRVRVLATPGHTATHLAYLVEAVSGEGPGALFTGGSLLFGSVGRTDLLGSHRTEELTREQHRSARRLARLPGETRVFPTHGFGSFCSSGSAGVVGDTSTIAEEFARNEALLTDDEDAFAERLIAGLTAYPAYYAHMGVANLAGAGPVDLSAPTPVEPDELRKRLAAREWVVDLRSRTAYAAEHLAGTVSIELGGQMSTYLGWLMPWGAPVTLLGDSAEQVAEAQRQLVRIGIDRPEGAAVGAPAELAADADQLRQRRIVTFDDLAGLPPAERSAITVLDIRRDDERAAGGIGGSLHVPLHELLRRTDEVPARPVWVHCRSGVRAAIGCSLLARLGYETVHVDDTFDRAVELGLV